MIDGFDDLLYGGMLSIFGGSATLTLDVTDAVPVVLSAYNGTGGVEIGNPAVVSTIRPVADVRATELASKGISVAALRGAVLNLAGKDWTVQSHEYKTGLNGDESGLIRLILEAA
jgi:hypothetical protein